VRHCNVICKDITMRDSDVCTQFRFEVAARFVTGHRVCPCHRDLLTSKLICVSYVCRTTFRPNVHGGAEKTKERVCNSVFLQPPVSTTFKENTWVRYRRFYAPPRRSVHISELQPWNEMRRKTHTGSLEVGAIIKSVSCERATLYRQ